MRNVSLSIISSHKIDLCHFLCVPKCVRNSVVKTISDTWRWTTPTIKRNEEAKRNEFITSIITSYKWNKSYQMYTFFSLYSYEFFFFQHLQNVFSDIIFFRSSCSLLWFGSLHSYSVLLQLLWFIRRALITSTKVHTCMVARVRQTDRMNNPSNKWFSLDIFLWFRCPFQKPRMIL